MFRLMTRTFIHLTLASALVSECALSANPHALAPLEEPLAGQFYAAIWHDIESNALIGNGNELAARWANAGSGGRNARQLHIQNLVCSDGRTLRHCQFELLRDGGITTYLGETSPDKLTCNAEFRRSGLSGDWSIPRLPPPRSGGHSRITIDCKPLT
jgi:hypothetical protein